MTYDGVTYYYITNPMGDVTGIAKGSGIQLVFYYYTAYGTAYVSYNSAYQTLAATLFQANPLLYRGYVYDRETGLYYLQSRYYNPKVGRFINADALVSTGQGLLGNNMFAYCRNNPISRIDTGGTEDMEIDLDGNDFTEDEDLMGGGGSGGSGTVGGADSSSTFGPGGKGSPHHVNSSTSTGSHGGGNNYKAVDISGTEAVPSGNQKGPTLFGESYYGKKAPKFDTPNSTRDVYRFNGYTGKWERSTAYYDYAGRQYMRIDWTNHGYADHSYPHIHFYTYNEIYPDGIESRINLYG